MLRRAIKRNATYVEFKSCLRQDNIKVEASTEGFKNVMSIIKSCRDRCVKECSADRWCLALCVDGWKLYKEVRYCMFERECTCVDCKPLEGLVSRYVVDIDVCGRFDWVKTYDEEYVKFAYKKTVNTKKVIRNLSSCIMGV